MIEVQSTPTGLKNLRDRMASSRKMILQPPSRESLSSWSNNFIRLGQGGPEPGPYRWQRAPYQQGILDACGDPLIERVAIMTSAQVGKTSILLNTAGYYIANDPSSIMFVMPDKASADSLSQTKLEPIIESSPILNARIAAKSKRDGGNRKSEKTFPGGYVVLVSAKSAHSLRSRSVRVLLLDEIDAYESTIGDEGNPIKIAEARTSNFPNRKIILTSTPTIKDFSNIEREYLAGDRRVFMVPCPHCGVKQELKWGGRETEYGIKYNEDLTEIVYRCESCKEGIKESKKLWMLQKGEWTVTNPAGRYPSFHISSLYSVWVSWQSIVLDWIEANKYPEKLPAFFNLRLGQPYEDKSNLIEFGEMADRLMEYESEVPAGVGFITAGVDVQDQWIEVGVWGHGVGEEMWMIDNYQLIGQTSEEDVWNQLFDSLKKKYKTKSGKEMAITNIGIDSGHQTDIVYRYVAQFKVKGIQNIFPAKGFDGARAVFEWSRYKTSGKPRLGIVGVSQAKSILYQRLKNVKTYGPGYIHFPASVHPEVLEQINSERRITIYDKGNVPKTFWKKLRERNEQLDCMVYAYAAFHAIPRMVTQQIEKFTETEQSQPPTEPQQTEAKPQPPQVLRKTIQIPRKTGGGIFGKGMW